jgi:hypothetical protein
MKISMETLGAALVEVVINDLNDGTFYAQLILDTTSVEIDARPSDAIALAVRFQAPIYVSEEVINEAGCIPEGNDADAPEDDDDDSDRFLRATQSDEEEDDDTLPSSKPEPTKQAPKPKTRLEALKQELDKAIAQEDYEKAATLRDEIAELSQE